MLAPFRFACSFLICIQLILGPGAIARAEIGGKTPSEPNSFHPPESEDAAYRALVMALPGGKQILNHPFLGLPWGAPAKEDPILDQRPYFLAGQSWHAAPLHTESSIRIHVDRSGFEIQGANASVAVHIEAPLRPFVEADDYLFLQGTEALFRTKAESDASYGEGLFFIDKRDLTIESATPEAERHGVPVMFMPLDGRGWTKRIEVIESSDVKPLLALANSEGHTVSFTFDELDMLSKAYHQTLELAVTTEMFHHRAEVLEHLKRSHEKNPNGRITLPYILPPVGSTALFGAFVTGLNLDNPSHSFREFAFEPRIMDYFFPRAFADAKKDDTAHQLWTVASVSLALLVAGSFATVFTSFGDKVAARNVLVHERMDAALVKEGKPVPDRTKGYARFKSVLGDHMTVYSHSLTATYYVPTVGAGYLFEYGMKRLYGALNRQPHPSVARALEKTFILERRNAENLSNNDRTLMLGAGLMGVIDTSMVYVQLMHVNQYFMPWAGSFISPEKQAEMIRLFSGADATGNQLRLAELLRNLSTYELRGSFELAATQRYVYLLSMTVDVDRELYRKGLNPNAPAVQQQRTRMIEARIDAMMVAQGFPAQDEKLFSAPDLIRKVPAMMGYKADRQKLDVGKNTDFLLENGEHQGQLAMTLKRAVKHARNVLERSGRDPNMTVAVKMLEQTQADYHTLTAIMKNPLRIGEALKKGFEVRQMLTELSVRDDEALFAGYVPNVQAWRGHDSNPEAARLAAQIFRQSFFSVIDQADYYLQPSAEDLKNFAVPPAAAMNGLHLGVADGLPQIGLAADHLRELNEVKAKIYQHEKSIRESKYEPNKNYGWMDGGMAERSRARILAKAERAVDQLEERGELITDAALEQTFRTAYRKAYLDEVGLHVYPLEKSELVRRCLENTVEGVRQTLSLPAAEVYYDKLDENERQEAFAHLHAETFVSEYLKMTINNPLVVSLTSPEQPGRFQRARQHRFVAQKGILGRSLTLALRIAESPWANTSYELGRKSFLERNVPMYQDFTNAIRSRMRSAPGELFIRYHVNYYAFSTKFLWPQAFYLYICNTVPHASIFMLNRAMSNIGIPAIQKTVNKIIYGLIWSWMSYPMFAPFFLTVKSFQHMADTVSTKPMLASALVGAAAVCGAALGNSNPQKWFKRGTPPAGGGPPPAGLRAAQ